MQLPVFTKYFLFLFESYNWGFVPEEEEVVLLVALALFALDVPVVLSRHLVFVLLVFAVVKVLTKYTGHMRGTIFAQFDLS